MALFNKHSKGVLIFLIIVTVLCCVLDPAIGSFMLIVLILYGIWYAHNKKHPKEFAQIESSQPAPTANSSGSFTAKESDVFYIHKSKATTANCDSIKKKCIILDFETTGVSATKDRIVSVAAIKYENEKEVDRFYSLVNPERHIPYESTEVHGITDEMVKDAPKESEMCQRLAVFLDDAMKSKTIICAYNSSFDAGFLHDAMNRSGIPGNIRHFDVLALARSTVEGLKNYKQVTVAKNLRINTEGAHNAMRDCEMCAEILFKLLAMEDPA